jgi:hypothetical protein
LHKLAYDRSPEDAPQIIESIDSAKARLHAGSVARRAMSDSLWSRLGKGPDREHREQFSEGNCKRFSAEMSWKESNALDEKKHAVSAAMFPVGQSARDQMEGGKLR